MRFVVALLAVLGLLASPVAAAAAQVACNGHADQAMAAMPMTDMDGMHRIDAQKPDPCCDHSKNERPSKHHDSDCVQACAAMCGVVAALPSTPVAAPLPLVEQAPHPSVVASLHPHEPSRLERPPRSIA
ncbi:hypothetical protein LJR225_005190 [Phenylobacterium sp. LjRoot225]|uniref:hypothetical protein n=1 Tax=Phenylobacterium sp. LjRoot225 TaxID=3342285 RepID=UPI003ED04525